MINGEEITDSNIIASKFCYYFTDIGPRLSKNFKMAKNINGKDFQAFQEIDDISILKII